MAYPRIDQGTVKTGCVTCFAMPRISTYIFSCCIYSSQCFTYPLLVMGWIQTLVKAPINHRFSQHPLIWNPGKGLVWGFESRISPCNCSFTVFPLLSQVWGGTCSHPTLSTGERGWMQLVKSTMYSNVKRMPTGKVRSRPTQPIHGNSGNRYLPSLESRQVRALWFPPSQLRSSSSSWKTRWNPLERTLRDPRHPTLNPRIAFFDTFAPCSQEAIRKMIGGAQSKSCDLDPIPTSILKVHLDTLLPYLTRMCNMSIREGSIPSSQTTAIVTPRLKKAGLDATDMQNFRPISNLSFMSKVVERIVASQLLAYLNSNSLLPKLQSGFDRRIPPNQLSFESCPTFSQPSINNRSRC